MTTMMHLKGSQVRKLTDDTAISSKDEFQIKENCINAFSEVSGLTLNKNVSCSLSKKLVSIKKLKVFLPKKQ